MQREMYGCSLCNYKHKRLSELNSHCKNKHTRNTIIRHSKMDIENFTKVSFTNHVNEEIGKKLKVKLLICYQKSLEKTPDKHCLCFRSNPFVDLYLQLQYNH